MSNRPKKPKKKKNPDTSDKKSKSNSDSKAKESKKQAKKINPLEPPKLTKEQEEKILKDLAFVAPQALDTLKNIDIAPLISAQDIIDSQLAPIREMQKNLVAFSNIAYEATSVMRMQQKLIADALEPMRQMQETIRQASSIYETAFANMYPNFEFLSGLIVDVSFTKTTFKDTPKVSRVYDYDEVNSSYDLEENQLKTPLIVTKESETEKAILAETQQINMRFGLFQKEILEENQKLQVMLKSERADKKQLLSKIEKLEKMVMAIYMDGQSHQVQVDEVKPNTGFTKLLVKMSNGELREVSFGRSKLEVIVLRSLYHPDLEEYEIISDTRLNNVLRDEISTKQMVDASDRINQKVYTVTQKKEFIKIHSRQEVQLNPDF